MKDAAVAQLVEHPPCKRTVRGSMPRGGTILTAHQACYMPHLAFFAKFAQADLVCILDTVQFGAKAWENRCHIKTAQGPLLLTVPVESGHLQKTGGNIRIVHNGWARKHCRSIELAYSKAPFFEEYFYELHNIISTGYEYLSTLNTALLGWLMAHYNIKMPMTLASVHHFAGTKSDLVLDMCRKLGAREYIFGSQGRDYADLEAFAAAGIRVRFQDFDARPYAQLHGDFLPRMSAIDALFNLGPAARELLT